MRFARECLMYSTDGPDILLIDLVFKIKAQTFTFSFFKVSKTGQAVNYAQDQLACMYCFYMNESQWED